MEHAFPPALSKCSPSALQVSRRLINPTHPCTVQLLFPLRKWTGRGSARLREEHRRQIRQSWKGDPGFPRPGPRAASFASESHWALHGQGGRCQVAPPTSLCVGYWGLPAPHFCSFARSSGFANSDLSVQGELATGCKAPARLCCDASCLQDAVGARAEGWRQPAGSNYLESFTSCSAPGKAGAGGFSR